MDLKFIRLRDAPRYLGMDIHRFNSEVRSSMIEIPIGKQGIASDRLDLDAWADDYKQHSGRPSAKRSKKLWDVNEHQDCRSAIQSDISTNMPTDIDFAKALALETCKKRKSI